MKKFVKVELFLYICIIKAGAGKKYCKTLSKDEMITVESDEIMYSKADGSKKYYKLK
jgi:hypothetical protein